MTGIDAEEREVFSKLNEKLENLVISTKNQATIRTFFSSIKTITIEELFVLFLKYPQKKPFFMFLRRLLTKCQPPEALLRLEND